MNEFAHCPTEGAIGLLALLITSGRLAEARLDDALSDAHLTFVKWRALDTLMKAGAPVPLKQLPAELHCVKSNVTQLIDSLEAERIVRRMPDPEDRRSVLVTLTVSGGRAHRAGREALESATQSLFSKFTEKDREALRKLLNTL